jgi:hypothetical protein
MKIFYCYSGRLMRALYNNGFRIISTGINPKTKSFYWCFIGSDILNYYKDNLYQKERDKF